MTPAGTAKSATGPPPGVRTVLVIHNPTAGRRRRARLAQAVRFLDRLRCVVTVQPTRRAGDAETLARDAVGQGYDAIVAAGGDGTVNEVINGLGDSDETLGIIPLGTANVLAAEIGLVADPAVAARTIVRGTRRDVWLGRVTGAGQTSPRLFSMMAGVGFDARVVAGVDPKLKRWTGKFAYLLRGVIELIGYKADRFSIVVDGRAYTATSAIIANGRYYGGRYVSVPGARLDDGWLHVCLFQRGGRRNMIRYGLALLTGRLTRLPDVAVEVGRSIAIEGPPDAPLHADGDIVAALPATVEISPKPLTVLFPTDDGGR